MIRKAYDRFIDFGWEQFDIAMYAVWGLFPWIVAAVAFFSLIRLMSLACG